MESNKESNKQDQEECFLKTFKNTQNHFLKRIWNTFIQLDTLCYYRLCDIITTLFSLKITKMVNESLLFVFQSIMMDSFKIFSTPDFKTFYYDDSKSIHSNLYNFTRITIKTTTTVKVPESRNKLCLVFGFIFCILPEFILRKMILGPLMLITFGFLLLTSWVGVFIFTPLLYMVRYLVKLISKIIIVFIAIVTTAVLAVSVFIIAGMYFVFMAIFMFSLGLVIFIIYPILFGIRCIIFSLVAIVYYILKMLSVVKTCCFVTEIVV